MITRNCQKTIGLLLTGEDLNIRITIAKNACPATRFIPNSAITNAWKEYIRNSVEEITNNNKLPVDIWVVKNDKVTTYQALVASNKITSYFWEEIWDADGIRITITQNEKQLSWIIARL